MAGKPTYEELEQRVKELEKENVEYKAAQRALQLSEQQLSLIYDSVVDVLYYIRVEPDDCFSFLSINQAFLDATGLAEEQIVGKRIEEVIPEPSVWMVRDNYKKAIEENRIVRWEETSVYTSGKKIGDVSIAPVLNEDEICTHLVGSVHDITERVGTEEALRKREERYGLLFNSGNDAVFVYGIGNEGPGKFTEVNDVACIRLGYSREELLRMSPVDIDTGGMDEARRRALEMLAETGKCVFEMVHLSKSGDKIPVEISSRVFESEGERHVLSIARDITERKRAEEELRESEEKYRGLFDESIAAVYLFDEKKNFLDSNQAGLDLLGYSREELLSMSIPDVDADPIVVLPAHEQLLSGDRIINYEHKLKRKDGNVITVLNNSRPLTNDDGQVVGMQSTLIDISARKKAEDMLKQANEELEQRVEHRTVELSISNEQLEIQKKNLEEVNTALRVLLKKRDEDKSNMEQKVVFNMNELILPYMLKLNSSDLDERQKVLLDILESNLNDITSPFSQSLSHNYKGFTPSEMQISNLIKQGKTSKQIADHLNLSSRTIETHRKNIRKKLGLGNKKVNLTSYLKSIQ